jgi:sialate O-acetylesterase
MKRYRLPLQAIVVTTVFVVAPDTTAALEVSAGLSDFQVIQRGSDGKGSVEIRGQARGGGTLRARVLTAGRPLPGFSDTMLTSLSSGSWEARLEGLPTGGPYRVELYQQDASSNEAARVAIDNILVGDLWILGGQSNMVGRAELANVEAPDERVHAFRPSGGWAVAKEPLHERRERNDLVIGAGLGLPFAKEMVRRTGVPVGLIPCAKGGTSLWEWDPALKDRGRESLYGNMLARFEETGGRVKGMLWYQGESDTQPDRVPLYLDRFRSFVASVRKDLRQPHLPIYFTQLSRHIDEGAGGRNDETWNAIQEVQRVAASSVSNVGMVAAVDLELVDQIHVDTEGLKKLGVRFAKRACRDLFPEAAACSGLEPGPDFESVRWDSPYRLRIRFSGVNGALSAPGRVLGFDITDEGGRRKPLIFRAWTPPEAGNEVVLELTRRIEVPSPALLWYGQGMDPPCNLVDGEGMAAPVFGPVRLPARPRVAGSP